MVVIKVIHNTRESFYRDLPFALSREIRIGWEIKPATEMSGLLVIKATFLVQKENVIELHEGLVHTEEFPIAVKRSEIIQKAKETIEVFKKEIEEAGLGILGIEVLEGSYFSS